MASSTLNIQVNARDNASHVLKSLQSGIIRLVGAVVALTAAFKALTFPAAKAAEFEREMINVAKTTNFTDAQIAKLSTTMIDLSKDMSLSAAEMASIAAIAGQLGLGSYGVEAIEVFTESVAKASVTLGLTAEKAAEFGAQITSIFNLDPTNIEKVFSTLNELSNTSVATAGQIADIVKRIGSVGGVTLQQSSALAAFFRDMGVQVEVAGTSTVKVLSNMTAKASQFAEVAGLSTKEWLELMGEDTIVALTKVTSKLYEMDRAQRDATAKELFGGGRILSTFTKLIDTAADGYTRLQTHIDTANSAFLLGTSSIKEYEKVMTSTTEQAKVLRNALNATAIEIGDTLTPVVLESIKALKDFVTSDEGVDLFTRMGAGLKTILNGLKDLVAYLASFGAHWENFARIAGWLLLIKVGLNVLVSSGKKVTKIFLVLAPAIQRVGQASLLLAAGITSMSGAGLAASRVITALLGPIGLLITALGLAYAAWSEFGEKIKEFIGIETEAEILAKQTIRIDKANAIKAVEEAINTLSDIAERVAKAADAEIEIPLRTASVAEQIEFSKQNLSNIKNLANFRQQAETLRDNLQKLIEYNLQDIIVNPEVNIRALMSTEELEGLDDATAKLQELEQALIATGGHLSGADRYKLQIDIEEAKNKILSLADSEFYQSAKDGGSAYVDGLIKGMDDQEADLVNKAQALQNEIAETLASHKSRGVTQSYSDSTLEDTRRQAEEAKNNLEEYRKTLGNTQSELVKLRSKFLDLEKTAKSLADASITTALQKQVDALEQSIGTTDLTKILSSNEAYHKATLDAQKKSEEARATGLDAAQKLQAVQNATLANERLHNIELERKKLVTEQLYAYRQEEVAALLSLSPVETERVQAAANLNTITEANTQTLEQQKGIITDTLIQHIAKRDILQRQIEDFDAATRDTVQTVQKVDGAWDNVGKTVRALESKLEKFGASIRKILSDNAIKQEQKLFDLEIDDQLEKDLDAITKKYDKLVAKASKPRNLGGFSVYSGGSTTDAETLEKRKKEEQEVAKEKAKAAKLAKQQEALEKNVTKRIEEQRKAQSDYAKLAQDIQDRQKSGEFEGADGIQKYNEAILELQAAQKKMSESADASADSVKELGKVALTKKDSEGVNKYVAELDDLGKAGIKITASSINLQKALGDLATDLIGAERGKLTKPYEELNTEINTLVGNNIQLRKAVNTVSEAMAASAPRIDLSSQSLSKQNDIAIQLAGNLTNVLGLYKKSANVTKALEDLTKFSDEGVAPKDVEVKIVPDSTDLDRYVDSIQNEAPEAIEQEIIIASEGVDKFGKEVTEFSKKNPVEFEGTITVPEEEIKKVGKKVNIFGDGEGNTYESPDGTPVEVKAAVDPEFLQDNLDKENFTLPVTPRATGVQRNATGGAISGAGTSKSDSILSWLSNGEYVIQASSVAKFGKGFFDLINAGSLPKFAGGGLAIAGGGSSSSVATTSDSIDINFNSGGKSYKLHGERAQANAIVDLLKNINRG